MPFCYDLCPENTAAPNLAQIAGNHKLKYHYRPDRPNLIASLGTPNSPMRHA